MAPKISNEQIIRTVAAQLENPSLKVVSFGNQPAGSRFETLRAGVAAHLHKPLSDGSRNYYCGSCRHHVIVRG